MTKVSMQFGSYSIYLEQDLFQSDVLAKLCLPLHKRFAIITDSNLVDTYGERVRDLLSHSGCVVDLFAFPAGEIHKTRGTKEQLEDELLSKHYGRDSCLLALGGGLVSDLVGFLAATYCRGVPVIYLPTTLLAMVDASMGGKTGINTPVGKNLIGTFTPPYAVCVDVSTLQTLPDCEWRNGIAEMIKHGLIADANLFQQMQASQSLQALQTREDLVDLIQQNCAIKKMIVEQDELEHSIRQLLNFGHTIGHAIETLEDYQLGHGEAVAIGMLVECHLAVQAGYCSIEVLDILRKLLQNYGLPLQTKAFEDKTVFLQTLILDKKSIQSIPRFVLLTGIGHPYVKAGQYTHAVDPGHLERALEWAAENFSSSLHL